MDQTLAVVIQRIQRRRCLWGLFESILWAVALLASRGSRFHYIIEVMSIGGLALLGLRLIFDTRPAVIARQMDRALSSGSQIFTGLQISLGQHRASDPIGLALQKMTVERATRLALGVRPGRIRPIMKSFVPAVVIAVAMVTGVAVQNQVSPPRRIAAAILAPSKPADSYAYRPHSVPAAAVATPAAARVTDVRVRVTPPSDSRSQPYAGSMPRNGIHAAAGSTVQVVARCTTKLGGGCITFTPTEEADTGGMPIPADEEPMTVLASGCEVSGYFVVGTSGRMLMQIQDATGASLKQEIVEKVTLASNPPTVEILQPTESVEAWPDGTVMLDVLAQDDQGLSGLQLCRSLNGVMAPPLDIPVSPVDATRCPMRIMVRLDAWKLQDGDVVKVFVRAFDNDRSNPQQADSSTVTIRIQGDDTMMPHMPASATSWEPERMGMR